MRQCPICQELIDDNAVICPVCGEETGFAPAQQSSIINEESTIIAAENHSQQPSENYQQPEPQQQAYEPEDSQETLTYDELQQQQQYQQPQPAYNQPEPQYEQPEPMQQASSEPFNPELIVPQKNGGSSKPILFGILAFLVTLGIMVGVYFAFFNKKSSKPADTEVVAQGGEVKLDDEKVNEMFKDKRSALREQGINEFYEYRDKEFSGLFYIKDTHLYRYSPATDKDEEVDFKALDSNARVLYMGSTNGVRSASVDGQTLKLKVQTYNDKDEKAGIGEYELNMKEMKLTIVDDGSGTKATTEPAPITSPQQPQATTRPANRTTTRTTPRTTTTPTTPTTTRTMPGNGLGNNPSRGTTPSNNDVAPSRSTTRGSGFHLEPQGRGHK